MLTESVLEVEEVETFTRKKTFLTVFAALHNEISYRELNYIAKLDSIVSRFAPRAGSFSCVARQRGGEATDESMECCCSQFEYDPFPKGHASVRGPVTSASGFCSL